MPFLVYTPLEQFDEVVWFLHNTLESGSWLLHITNREFDSRDRWSSLFDIHGLIINSKTNFVILCMIVSSYIILQYSDISLEKVYIGYILFVLYFLTGGVLTLWFTDFSYNEIIVNLNVIASNGIDMDWLEISSKIAPQIVYGLSIDEIRISWIIGFFLMNTGSMEDENDFFILEYSDLDIIEEIVAPLFVANLGSHIKENAGLYLKVCSLFSFVLISNLLGRIPYNDTATSSLILTFWVSFSVFIALVWLRLSKHGYTYFFSLFRPAGCPFPLIFLLIPIEFLSYCFRLVSLAVRLFANRRAGHTLRKVLIGFSYVRFTLGEGFSAAAFLPALVVFVLVFLERAVAGIQAYIFTILICIYLKDIYVSH